MRGVPARIIIISIIILIIRVSPKSSTITDKKQSSDI